VASVGEHTVALFMTGWRHAGENLGQLLHRRAAELSPPIQMCDALSRNTCGEFDSVLAHCLGHYPEPTFIRRELIIGPSIQDARGV